MRYKFLTSSTLLILFHPFLFGLAAANVKVPAIFGAHMVLQQAATLPVWGWADPGEKVTVSFGGLNQETTAGADGKWRVDFAPVAATNVPDRLVISGNNKLTFDDVVVGDVWLFSGQSNMEFALQNSTGGKEATDQATNTEIRFFRVLHRDGLAPCDDVKASWQVCSPHTASSFSAVGYYFARDLAAANHHPLGLIETAWSGSCGQAWIDLPTLQSNPATKGYADDFAKAVAAYPGGQDAVDTEAATYQTAQAEWQTKVNADPSYALAIKDWKAACAEAKANHQTIPPAPAPPIPPPPVPAVSQRTPAMLFNGMLAPLIPYAIKGVLWYQGEDNTGIPMAFDYRNLLPMLVTDWRSRWAQGDFPFLVVQLPNYGPVSTVPGERSTWAVLRESQTKVLSLPKTGLAVTIDLSDGNLHPPDKADVGHRAALTARAVAYGETVAYRGPTFSSMKVEGSAIRISYDPATIGGGLVIGASPRPEAPSAPASLQGFAIAGSDQKWVWADASIDGTAVVVSSPQVTQPVAVRYAWGQNPPASLYNKDGLPAVPFRTDDWPPF